MRNGTVCNDVTTLHYCFEYAIIYFNVASLNFSHTMLLLNTKYISLALVRIVAS